MYVCCGVVITLYIKMKYISIEITGLSNYRSSSKETLKTLNTKVNPKIYDRPCQLVVRTTSISMMCHSFLI